MAGYYKGREGWGVREGGREIGCYKRGGRHEGRERGKNNTTNRGTEGWRRGWWEGNTKGEGITKG